MHAQHHPVRIILCGALLGLLLSGCAANVGKNVKVSDAQLNRYDTLSPAEAISALRTRISDAKRTNMPFFAPDYFREAAEILSDVQQTSEKRPKAELISSIAKADAILDKGVAMMAIVQSNLADEFALKGQMDIDNVAKLYHKEYEKSVTELVRLIEKVELDKADNIEKDKLDLLKTMQALDIKAIQYNALHDSEVMNEDTLIKRGEKQAPITLTEAQHIYLDARNRIALAPYDAAVVKRAGDDARFAANHAHSVNERVSALQELLKGSVESVVLGEENRLLDISTALGYKDLRDQPIGKQVLDIARIAREIVQGQQQPKQTIGVASDQSKILEARLKEAESALQKANVQLAEKDAQLAQLSDKAAQNTDTVERLKPVIDQNAQPEETNKSLFDGQAVDAKASKIQQ